MGKELTIAQLTFVDLYDSYTLSLSSDVIAVPCNPDGEALNTTTYKIKYSIRAGEKMVAAKCESTALSQSISGITFTPAPSDSTETTEGTISVKVNSTTKIPEDSGINISVKTNDSNEFVFNRFISFMNIKSGQDGDSGRGIQTIQEEYATNNSPSQAPAENSSDWSTDPKTPTEDKQYLWNRELLTYDKADENDQTQSYTTPRIISIYGKAGDPGRGIESIVEYYAASNSAESPATSQQYITGANTVTVTEIAKAASNVNIVGLQTKSTGYYSVKMSDQANVGGNYAYCLIQLKYNITQPTQIVLSCVSYGESRASDGAAYDYMVVSNCNSDYTQVVLSQSYNVSNDIAPIKKIKHSFEAQPSSSTSDFQDIVFDAVTPGTYYIYIKVVKDSSHSRDGETFEFKCMERKISWQTSVPDDYGPDYPYLWNYTRFNYTDGGTSSSDPQVIAHWGLDGADAFTLKVVTDVGDVFTQKPDQMIEKITLSLEAYEGANKINVSVPYVWKYYTFDSSDGDDWVELSSGTANIEDISLTVNISDPYAYSLFRCEIYYKNTWFSDYETLKEDVHDVYYAKTILLDDNMDGNCAVLYTELVKNGEVIDQLPTTNVYFVDGLKLTDNSTGYFKTDDTYQIVPGSHTTGELVYLVSYRYVTCLQYINQSDQGEFAYSPIYNMMYNREAQSGELPYKTTSTGKQIYHLVLARYDGTYWRPYNSYDVNEYCYINSSDNNDVINFTFSNAKIFVVDKKYLSESQSLSVAIHNKVYDSTKTFQYYVPYNAINKDETAFDIWKMYNYYAGEDTKLFSFDSTVFQSIKTSYIEECFSRKSDGVYITQKVTTLDTNGDVLKQEPFYVKIDSQRMGFWAQAYNSAGQPIQEPVEMVHIGNNSTNIRNSVLEGNTSLNGDITIFKQDKSSGAFVLQRESDGSISLVLG